MTLFTPRPVLAFLGAVILFSACEFGGPGGPDRGGGREKRLASVTRMKSSVLKPLAKPAVPSGDERCDFGRPCITPINLEGRIYAGHLMVGGNGGPPGRPVRVVEGYDTSYHGPETGRGGIVHFNLGKSTDLASQYGCCEGGYPPDNLALVHRLEFLFDYLDATFQVPLTAGAAVAGKTYTIRMVYVDSGAADDLPMGKAFLYKGDKLLKRQGEDTFLWCTGSGCVAAARPAEPLRARWHADTALTAYPHYTTVGISLKTPMSFTRAEAEAGSWRFTVDWDLTRAAVFHTTDWARIQSEAELVEAFDLLSGHGGPGGIGVYVNLTKASFEAAPKDSTGAP